MPAIELELNPVASLMPNADAVRLAAVFKALGNPVRVRLLQHISADCCSSVCICHMPTELGVSQPTLSHHLSKLVDAGLVTREMRGKWAHYRSVPGALDPVRGYLDAASVSCDPGLGGAGESDGCC